MLLQISRVGLRNWQNEDRWQERLVVKVPKCCKVGSRAAEREPVRGKTTRGPCLARGGCRTNEVSCHCHKESGAAVTWRLRMKGDKWFIQGRAAAEDYSAETANRIFWHVLQRNRPLMPNQASACETGMESAQTELEEDLGSFQIQSEEAGTETLHTDARRSL